MYSSDSFFSLLRGLPLFQGLSNDSLSEIIEKTALAFSKVASGQTFVQQDTPCTRLTYVIRGSLTAISSSHDHSFSIEEHELHLPHVIEPETLMGMRTLYTRSYRAGSDSVQLMTLDKPTITDFMARYEVFRLNYLNQICHKAQQSYNRLWSTPGTSIEDRFIDFLRRRMLSPGGRKTIRIDMNRLSEELYCTRRSISAMLHRLEDKGLMSMQRRKIEIPQMENL